MFVHVSIGAGTAMKFIDIGEGAEIGRLDVKKNVVIVDDLSQVETFISVGKNGKIETLDAEGNEVHTPASYMKKLESDRAVFFAEVESVSDSIDQIEDELLKRRIKNALAQARLVDISPEGEHKFKQIIRTVFEIAKNTGASVLATCISAYIGYVPA
jgi:hypothetical protein